LVFISPEGNLRSPADAACDITARRLRRNYAPPGCEIARHVIDAFVAKDYQRAATLQLQFALFPAKWMHRGLAPAMKAAMNPIGVMLVILIHLMAPSAKMRSKHSLRSCVRRCSPTGSW
jgi:hypothetical protein